MLVMRVGSENLKPKKVINLPYACRVKSLVIDKSCLYPILRSTDWPKTAVAGHFGNLENSHT